MTGTGEAALAGHAGPGGDRLRYVHDGHHGVWFDPLSLGVSFVRHPDGLADSERQRLLARPPAVAGIPRLRRFRLEVTDRCNATCSYCIVGGNGLADNRGHMNTATADEILAMFRRQAPRDGDLLLMGGEPLTNWPVVKKVVDSVDQRILLFTNATLVDTARARLLAQPHVRVVVSLDGLPQHDTARRLAGGASMRDRSLRGYRLLKEAGATVAIGCLVTEANVGELRSIARWFVDVLSPDAIGFSLPHAVEGGHAEVDPRDYADGLVEVLDELGNSGPYVIQLAQRLQPLLRGTARRHGCMVAAEQWTFAPRGERILCSKLGLLGEGWGPDDGSRLSDWSPLVESRCARCPWRAICGGGCFWDGLKRFGSGQDLRECLILDRLVPALLLDMARRRFEHGERWLPTYEPLVGPVGK